MLVLLVRVCLCRRAFSMRALATGAVSFEAAAVAKNGRFRGHYEQKITNIRRPLKAGGLASSAWHISRWASLLA